MFENSNKMCVGWWKEWWKSTSPWHMYLYCCFCFSFRDVWNMVIALLGLPVTNQKVLENNSSSYSRLVFIKQFEILKPFNPNLIWLGKPEQTKTWMQKKNWAVLGSTHGYYEMIKQEGWEPPLWNKTVQSRHLFLHCRDHVLIWGYRHAYMQQPLIYPSAFMDLPSRGEALIFLHILFHSRLHQRGKDECMIHILKSVTSLFIC